MTPTRASTPTDAATVVEPGAISGGPGMDKTSVWPSADDNTAAAQNRTIVEGSTSSPAPTPVKDSATVVESSTGDAQTHVVGAPSRTDTGGGSRQTRVMSLEEEDVEERRPIFAWLVVMEGSQQYADFRIDREQVYVGGSSDCDIVLQDEFISGEHASIRYREGEFTITDLDSKNGTFVNDMSPEATIDRVSLNDGDEIQLGQVLLKFKCL